MIMPLSILIVDDETVKVRHTIEALIGMDGVAVEGIRERRDAYSAKKLMQDETFDLVIIDIVLPDRIDSAPHERGGVDLVRAIMEQRKVLPAGYIVGLTAHAEILSDARELFASRGWVVIQYDSGGTDWIERLGHIVGYLVWAKRAEESSVKTYGADACVICALNDPELKSVLDIKWGWRQHMVNGDHTVYYRGTFRRDDRDITVFAACAPRMGLANSAALTAKMIGTFVPRYCFMTGIAAGIEGKCNLGDVLVADQSWDYGSGKYEVVDKRGVFSPAPYQLPLDVDSRSHLLEIAADLKTLDRISSDWPGDRPSSHLRIVLGPLASGGAVVADPSKVQEIVATQRKLIGIEMETYALFAAAAEAARPRPLAISIKSVSDFADSSKSDAVQKYAAYTSAQVFREFCERFA